VSREKIPDDAVYAPPGCPRLFYMGQNNREKNEDLENSFFVDIY